MKVIKTFVILTNPSLFLQNYMNKSAKQKAIKHHPKMQHLRHKDFEHHNKTPMY